MSELKLLPCPFCGGEVEISDEKIDATREVYNFHCHNCDMVTFYDFPNDRESAIKQWNTRKPIDNIVEKLEEKTDFLKDCTKYGNESAEQQEKSYSTMMMYEVADLVDDLIDIVKQEINNGLE